MLRRLVLLLALVAFTSAAAEAAVLRGKRLRSYTRHRLLVEKLEKDKLLIYKEYGYPRHRLREYAYGRIREQWTYYEAGRTFVFDDESNLVKTERFWPEDRRERIERFPDY